MSSIKERAAALKLAEKLCVRPQAPGVASRPVQSSMWSVLISHLRSTVTVKRRRVHLKSHSDCFLGSEAVDVLLEHISYSKVFEGAAVSRDKVVCVCQALLDCNVFEAVGTAVFGKNKKRDEFQDSRSALYRFVGGCCPSVDELERGELVKGIQGLFCIAASDGQDELTCPVSVSHVQMSTPVKFVPTPVKVVQKKDGPTPTSLTPVGPVEGVSPGRGQSDSALPQSLVEEVWQELTLLRLLNLVDLPLLEGVLQCSQTPPSPLPPPPLPDSSLMCSSHHLDRQILKAFRDSQEDEWLRAGLDLLDFLPDQPVVELSRELPHCFPQDQGQDQDQDQDQGQGQGQDQGQQDGASPRLSSGGSAQCKLLLYSTLVKHYSHTDRTPLLPQRMSDIYTAITDLLVKAKLSTALESLQLCLKLLPAGCRDELQRLLTFMALAADPQGIKLDKELENRAAVKRSFSRSVLHSRVLSKEKEDLMLIFMLSNVNDIFKIPASLHKGVSEKLAGLRQTKQPELTASGFTFCQRVCSETHGDSTKKTTNQELKCLLSSIHMDTKTSSKEKKRLLGQFYQAHPEVFDLYFGESAVNVL